MIYCGDRLEILPLLLDNSVDLVLTDPPYGIGMDKTFFMGATSACQATPYTGDWDSRRPSKECFDLMIQKTINLVIFGGNYFIDYLYPTACWLIWDKDNGNTIYADCEIAWTSFQSAVRIFKYRWQGMLQEHAGKHKETRVHPTQKPLPLFKWILENYSETNQLILDPFLGSGTTAVAAKNLRRKFIGIEISERYCKIAVERLKQEVLSL